MSDIRFLNKNIYKFNIDIEFKRYSRLYLKYFRNCINFL